MKKSKEEIEEQLIELKKLTKTATNVDLAKALGTARGTIQNWKIRGSIPNAIFLKAEMLSEQGSEHVAESVAALDFYDIDVSAGPGTLALQEKKSDSITFNKDFLINSLEVLPEDVFLMPVRGDSMVPTLKNQAIIMVKRICQFSSDGVYVFRYDGQLMVKRLQFLKAGLKVVSDNQTYETWELSRQEVETEDFEILGEVIWSGQRM
ncbi:S24 family peptidase [Psychromonas sp. Urea-02u-13]|uniref:S24 family peptidase n=1 Tax=Psychromonas sp. Urea-02u-13 TaxID=2058326 RepID=UPI000C336E8D|nr:S24 family peptidase [Psychromonas sp. Urea-02u-13]PKG37312.1 transcriptional regulator [Psychromonas sp. Urea-02u-13]